MLANFTSDPNRELTFDPDANLIQRNLSENVIRSFASPNWDMDDDLIKDLRAIFNAFLGFPEKNHNPFSGELKFDPNANLV